MTFDLGLVHHWLAANEAIETNDGNCACTVRSSFFLRNGSLIFGIVCLVTLLIFRHSLHLSAQLNVSISVIFFQFHIAVFIIIIINEEIIVAFSPRTTRTRYKVKTKPRNTLYLAIWKSS